MSYFILLYFLESLSQKFLEVSMSFILELWLND